MRLWIPVALLILVGVCAVNLAATARRIPPAPRRASPVPANVVMELEQRLAPLRRELTRRGVQGPVGYRTDLAPAEMRASARAMEQYFASQFVLAPVVLDAASDTCSWVVVNSRAPGGDVPVYPEFNVVQDFGKGLRLLQRRP